MINSKNKKPKNKKQMRKELFKNRPISDQERKIMVAEWESKVIMGSEGLMWTSEVVDGVQFEVDDKNIKK